MLDSYLEALDAAIGAIGEATPMLRLRVAAATLDAFGDRTIAKLRTRLAADFEPHLSQLTANRMRAFVDRALSDDVDDDRWLDGMASVVTGRRIDSWSDATLDEYAFEVRVIAARLVRWLALAKTRLAQNSDLVAIHVVGVDGSEETVVVRRGGSHPGRAERLQRVREALGAEPGASELLSELLAEAIALDAERREAAK